MGDFRSFERGDDRGGRSSGGFGGRSSGGRGGFGGSRGGFGGGRSSGGRDRRDMPMCDAVCAKCGKNCQVPFKPTGDKPVYCSDCFGAQRGEIRGPSAGGSSSGITSEQFQQLNSKLDQILVILNSLEMIDDEEDEDEDAEEVEEEKVA